jgi:hypothetical protein
MSEKTSACKVCATDTGDEEFPLCQACWEIAKGMAERGSTFLAGIRAAADFQDGVRAMGGTPVPPRTCLLEEAQKISKELFVRNEEARKEAGE